MRVLAVFMSFSFVGEVGTRPWQDVILGFNGAPQLHVLRGLTEKIAGGNLNMCPLDVTDDALEHPSIKMVEQIERILRELDPVVTITDEEFSVGIHIVYSFGHIHVLPVVFRDDKDVTMLIDERRDGLRNFRALRSQVDELFFLVPVENRSRVRYD